MLLAHSLRTLVKKKTNDKPCRPIWSAATSSILKIHFVNKEKARLVGERFYLRNVHVSFRLEMTSVVHYQSQYMSYYTINIVTHLSNA